MKKNLDFFSPKFEKTSNIFKKYKKVGKCSEMFSKMTEKLKKCQKS